MSGPVIKNVSYMLAHTPDLVPYGSKPSREIFKNPALLDVINSRLRGFDQAKEYPPHQVFIGNASPESLWDIDRPWFGYRNSSAARYGPWGEICPEKDFYGVMKYADLFDLLFLEESFLREVKEALRQGQILTVQEIDRLGPGEALTRIEREVAENGALPLYYGEHSHNQVNGRQIIGCIRRGHEEDDNLTAPILLENLACKATGIMALRQVAKSEYVKAADVGYVMGCGEEGVGDRYQRGAGNLAKAMAELSGFPNSSGSDVKAFCCSPVHAIVLAASLVEAGVFKEVIVVGGGSLAKLGMKYKGHVSKEMLVLEDVLGAVAIAIGNDDGVNPKINLKSVGTHTISAGSSPQAIIESLVIKPLEGLGLRISDIEKYALELHNPEITDTAGSGNVPRTNYRTIGGFAFLRGEIGRSPQEMDLFERTHGMPGFSPTQGHIAASIPFLGHACQRLLRRDMKRAMFVAKGSLFLGKMTTLSDGMSFVLERN